MAYHFEAQMDTVDEKFKIFLDIFNQRILGLHTKGGHPRFILSFTGASPPFTQKMKEKLCPKEH